MARNSQHGFIPRLPAAAIAVALLALLVSTALAQEAAVLARPQGAKAVSIAPAVVIPWTRPREALGIAEPPSKIHDNLWKFISTLPGTSGGATSSSSPLFQVRADGHIHIEVTCDAWDDAARATLEGLGFEVAGVATRPYILVDGWMPPARTAALQDIGFVRSVMNTIAPVSKSQIQADAIIGTASLRASDSTLDGRGVTVGVISDSSSLAARDQARAFTSGDGRPGLPAESRINVLQGNTGTNEGTGMMEIVYAMAPGSNLAFYGPSGSVDMSTAIQALANAGCKVIVDDLGFYSQPWFEKGTVEQTIDTVTGQDVAYVTAAGNDAQGWYTGTYNGANITILDNNNNPITMNANKFANHTTGGSDYFLPFVVGASRSATVYLQWDDPFTAASDDYDLFITDATGRIVNGSQGTQNGTQAPFEFATSPTPTANTTYYAVVRHKTGGIRRLKLVVSGAQFDANFDTPGGSIFEHSSAANALSVGAISAFDSGQTNIESFSSQGPVEIAYPSHTFRQKPDVAGIDDVTVSNAGGFAVVNGVKQRFTGTSAAAPSVAAVAAVLRSHRPGWGEAEVKAAIVASCTDKGAVGYDSIFGSGLVQAGPAVTTAEVIYVDPSASASPHDGSSWLHAYQTLQAAMNIAVSGDQIWCKYSVYNLTPPFVLKPGVKLYGGFDGSENGPKDRTPRGSVGLSTLTGGGLPGSVVTIPGSATSSTQLDGFRITGGTGTDPGFGQPWGGGVYIQAGGWPYLVNCEITGNSAAYGGGVWAGSSQSIFDRNDIHDNAASVAGGGMYLGTGSILVRDCRLANNAAPSGAGADCVGTTGSLMACIITNNQATGTGGGLRLEGNCQDFLLNDTIAINTAASGAGVSIDTTSNPWVINCIVAENVDGIAAAHTFTALNNDLWGNRNGDVTGQPNPTGANGNISADPQFVGSGNGWPADYFRVQPLSPVIDSGNPAYTGSQPADFAGNPRWLGPEPDIGAYEFVPPVTMYVKPDGNDLNDGLTWATAKATVQYAIDVLPYTDRGEVWVEKGTYPNTSLTVPSNVRIYGGFAGNETDKRSRNVSANPVILDATGTSGPAVTIADYATDLTILDGLTIQGGNNPSYGGGIYVGPSGRPVIQNCVIRNNTAVAGGGIYAAYGSPFVHANSISGNTSASTGGGILLQNDTGATVTQNVIDGNHAGAYGGGLFLGATSGRIADNIIAINSNDGGYGAGISLFGGSSPQIINNTFVDNQGSEAIRLHDGNTIPTIANNIIAFNSTGIATEGQSFPFSNNDVYDNPLGNYATLADATGLAGNIAVDPMIARDAFGSIHIQSTSPLRNAGDPTLVLSTDLDIDGQARLRNFNVDIGADESYGENYTTTGVFFVNAGRPDDSGDGHSWGAAKRTIQAGIDAASTFGGEVWVKAGTYTPDSVSPRPVTLRAGVSIFGGFSGTETIRAITRNIRGNRTTINGAAPAFNGPAVYVPPGVSNTTSIEGFYITGGNNTDGRGGGIDVASASPAIRFNTIIANTTSSTGGGIHIAGAVNPIVTNNIIDNNRAGAYGGGIMMEGSGGRIADNVFALNRSDAGYGSGLSLFNGNTSAVTNNTFVYNQNSAALFVHGISNAVIANNILAFNYQGIATEGQTFAFNNNDVWSNPVGNYVTIADQTGINGNIGADPLVSTDSIGIFHISPSSPARDAGGSGFVLAGDLDIDLQNRVNGPVDIGTDESYGEALAQVPVYFTSTTGSDANAGTSWAGAKRTVQGAINAASAALGGEVWVKAGTYNEEIALATGVSVFGGFAGSESTRAISRDFRGNTTILNAAGLPPSPVVTASNGVSYASVFEGFTVTGANTTDGRGGGIDISYASPTIRFNTIAGNYTSYMGGGIRMVGAVNPVVTNNIIVNDHAAAYGGGIMADGGAGRIADNVVAMDTADGGYGAGIALFASSASVLNNTIVDNPTSSGIQVHSGGNAVISNNIIAYNQYGVDGEGSSFAFLYNDTYGNTLGDYVNMTVPPLPDPVNHNISADPQVLPDALGTVRIASTSPARDAGLNSDVLLGELDIDAHGRTNGAVDMGAYEWYTGAVIPVARVVYVDAARPNDAGDGSAWATAKKTVQAGIGAASTTGGEVWVKQGTYAEQVSLLSGVGVYGGFSGAAGETRDTRSFRTTVSTLIPSAAAPNQPIVVAPAGMSYSAVLDGFTISGATTTDGRGGGVDVQQASPTIRFNVITQNTTTGHGGGMRLYLAPNAQILNNVISSNTASLYGGGIMVNSSGGRLSNNAITYNSNDGDYGAGLSLFAASPTVTNNTIAYNMKSDGLRVHGGGNPVIANNIVAFNTTGVNAESQAVTFRNNDVYGNVANDYVAMAPPPVPDGANHNLSSNPAFLSSANVRIAANSLCRDAGNDADAFGSFDLDGNSRVLGSHVDIGAYEASAPALYTFSEATRALTIAGGLSNASSVEAARLNVEPGSPASSRITVADAIRIARKAAGRDANP